MLNQTPAPPYVINKPIQQGIASGYTLIFTKQCLDWHQNAHASHRPELSDVNFLNEVIAAIENPDQVYQSSYVDQKSGKFKNRRHQFVFYKLAQAYTFNGQTVNQYVRVVVLRKKFSKILEVITPFYSAKINEKNRCQPITQI